MTTTNGDDLQFNLYSYLERRVADEAVNMMDDLNFDITLDDAMNIVFKGILNDISTYVDFDRAKGLALDKLTIRKE